MTDADAGPNGAHTGQTAQRLSRGARRAQLVSVAKSVFVSQGYHATAMDDIAERAGVSKPVLYQHFSSKLELYLALLAESAEEMVRLVTGAIDRTTDNSRRVHGAVDAYFCFVADNDEAYRLIFESDLRGQPEVTEIVDRAGEQCIAAIAESIVVSTGRDPDEARLLASGLVGASQVAARYWLNQIPSVDRSRAIEAVSMLAWRGLAGFPTRPA
ncbi:TetR/AcrR family transcriptional regulator [Nakamurella leprariae]|uniref:TetR/AcrR family transcriptional regulator n=1 Tax=Nakamurella leprariae TaxID=2803911 RepID=A0A939C038_9ACTN|nr:TetR/AcrR family transcriptional regulator [Nakamurella leprariae]MBM9465777.1 TetR/AcrR family transcriptional regulator [Nakamurella leprariae]